MFKNIIDFFINNKIVILLLFLVGIVAYFIKYKEGFKNKQVNKSTKKVQLDFLPSDKFTGAKNGYIFKNDRKGLGYYIDSN